MECIKYYNEPMNEHTIEYNTTFKLFPNGVKKVKHHKYSSIKGLYRNRSSRIKLSSDKKKYENLYNTKQRLIDLVYCNSLDSPWEYFVTLTFDPKKVDSYNYQEVVTIMGKWLDNIKHQNKNLKYILVPELHKSGRVHIHGLFKDCPNLKLVDSGKVKNGCKIYNIENYRYGFTTISQIKNQEAVSVYMSKYMTKELIDISGRKTYWCSQKLIRPVVQYAHFDYNSLKFYINSSEIKDFFENDKTVSFTLNGLHNIYYFNVDCGKNTIDFIMFFVLML